MQLSLEDSPSSSDKEVSVAHSKKKVKKMIRKGKVSDPEVRESTSDSAILLEDTAVQRSEIIRISECTNSLFSTCTFIDSECLAHLGYGGCEV